jgi:hypothetical protein
MLVELFLAGEVQLMLGELFSAREVQLMLGELFLQFKDKEMSSEF